MADGFHQAAEEGGEEDNTLTGLLVKDALAELRAKKKGKKKTIQTKVETGEDLEIRKGKTFAQIEHEETGGTIREAEVAMAQAKRAVLRKGQGLGETELVANVEDAEEVLEDEATEEATKEEVELTAFNLNEEREKGYFDSDGHYVERKDEDEDATDAWLESTEAKMATAEIRKQHEKLMQAMEEADSADPLSESALAKLKGEAAELMNDGETVTAALKRLGGGSRKPVLRSKNKKKAQAEDIVPEQTAADKEAFLKLTEAVDALMSAGETDIYTMNKRVLQSEAALYARPTLMDDDGEGGDDMFAESDGEDDNKPPAKKQATGGSRPEAAAEASTSGTSAGLTDAADCAAWSVKKLQEFLRSKGLDPAGAVEKSDLVERVKAAAAVPGGYLFHPESGYYWGEADSMYFHAESGSFYNPTTQEWCQRDSASGKFQPITQ